MARIPHTPSETLEHLGVEGRALFVGPPQGFGEAHGEGAIIAEPPPGEDASDDGKPAATVVVWVGPVPAHDVREYTDRVDDGGSLWVVLPKPQTRGPVTVNEADLKKSLLIRGWRDDRTLAASSDTYGIRFRRRR